MEPGTARRLWWALEPIHAVTYFAPECRDAMTGVGLKGFWMGYFAARAAPMGAVAPAVVEAAFFNFHPKMVRRAIPDAWALASIDAILDARSRAAADVVAGLAPDANMLAPLRDAIEHGHAAGRPLFAANRDLTDEAGDVRELWQATTTLREHRGDGHVAVLTESELDGCEAHVLFAASEDLPSSLFRDARGWSEEEWGAALASLQSRGLVDESGNATDGGRDLREHIERRTDELAAQPFEVLTDERVDDLLASLQRVASAVTKSGTIRFPNPMGLPAPRE